jgi:hypothetical protein
MTLTEFLEKEKQLLQSATPIYEHRIAIYHSPGDLLEGSPAYNFVKTVSKNNYDELRTSHAKALEIIEVMREALEKLKAVEVTDGCEECSSIWTKRYEFNIPIKALTRAEEILK